MNSKPARTKKLVHHFSEAGDEESVLRYIFEAAALAREVQYLKRCLASA